MHFLDSKKLGTLMRKELEARGASSESAQHVVASVIQSSLRGVDSHGINLFPHYCHAVEVGRVKGFPEFTWEQTAAATSRMDADHAFGHYSGAAAMDRAIAMASDSGVGTVSVSNSTHFGAAAYFGLRAAENDYVGFSFTNADALVKAHGAKEAFFGTNPICFTAPMMSEDPFCLDMATSMVSWNKVMNYRMSGTQMPSGWAFDADGVDVVDPDLAVSLSPAGSYKGFGLGMMVDILCSLLAGGKISKDLRPMYQPPLDNSKREISHFFMAVDICRFTDLSMFKQQLQEMVARIRLLTPNDTEQPVMVAGDPEKSSKEHRLINGIPIGDQRFLEFLDISEKFETVLMS